MANKALTPSSAHPLASLHQEVDKLFGNFFSDFPYFRSGQIVPKVDFKDTGDGYQLDAELPGVPAKEVEVSVANGVLTIKGEHKVEKEEKDKNKNYLRVERSYGAFERSVALPDDADDAKISANSKDGVLTITIPKKPGAKTEIRKIEVKAT